MIEYLYALIAFILAICFLYRFKKKPNDSAFNTYHNSRYYRVLILFVFALLALIISFFVNI